MLPLIILSMRLRRFRLPRSAKRIRGKYWEKILPEFWGFGVIDRSLSINSLFRHAGLDSASRRF
jgi:hypothetical protein